MGAFFWGRWRRWRSGSGADPVRPDHMRSYRSYSPVPELADEAEAPVILVQRDSGPSQMRSALQALGVEVFFGGHGIGAHSVPVIAVPALDLNDPVIRARIADLANEWPDASLFCIDGAARTYCGPGDWNDAGETTERLFESGLGHFIELDHDDVASYYP
jgi:hypothetical protein